MFEPDYARICDRGTAAALHSHGTLGKLHLVPLAHGGADTPENTLYVPLRTVSAVNAIMRDLVDALANVDRITMLQIEAEYQETSVIPIALKLVASDPEDHVVTVEIWGNALGRGRERFAELVDRHAGSVHARQLAWGAWFEGKPWELQLGEDVIRVAGEALARHDLGVEAHAHGTWMWSWASPQLEPGRVSVATALQLRAMGGDLPELTESARALGPGGGWAMAIVAAGLDGHRPIFRFVTGPPLSAYALVDLPTGLAWEPLTVEQVRRVIADVVEGGLVTDHRRMVRSFLADQGFSDVDLPRAVVARREGELLTVRFDALGRVEGMEARPADEAEAELDRLAAEMDVAEAAAVSPLPSAAPAPAPAPAAEASRPWWAFWR